MQPVTGDKQVFDDVRRAMRPVDSGRAQCSSGDWLSAAAEARRLLGFHWCVKAGLSRASVSSMVDDRGNRPNDPQESL